MAAPPPAKRARQVKFAAGDDVREYRTGASADGSTGAMGTAAAAAAAAADDLDGEPSQARARALEREAQQAHTLESDEEDVDEELAGKYELSAEVDLHEELDEKFEDGGTELTGFNLHDEMEEGFFDKDGNFIFKKTDDHAGDTWLETTDVYNAKRAVQLQGRHRTQTDRVEDDAKLPDERFGVMEEILKMLKDQETVAAALKRLGGGGTKQPRRKQGNRPAAKVDEKPAEVDQRALDRLTRLADALMAEGMYDIFQMSREKIAVALRERNVAKFVYKWTDDEEAEVHGPYSAQQMLEWKNAGFFKEGVFVREVNKAKQALFYPSQRIDFELYIDEEED